ncbi:MAG: EAL domain-containing protein, partial [Gammaproteobacteria bacterium]|nr:EAL domain-containing protein [Gammaproteobacteria bacterium]
VIFLIWLLAYRNRQLSRQQKQSSHEAKRVQDIIDSTRAGTWEWNIQTGKTRFNEHWASILGYKLAELSPTNIQTWVDLTHPEDIQLTQDILQDHFDGKRNDYEADFRMKHKAGHWVWIHDRGRITEWGRDNKPLWMRGIHLDISTRKQAALDQQKAQEKYQRLADDIGDKFVIYSHKGLSGELTYVSDGITSVFGLSKDEVMGKPWAEQVNWLPEDIKLAQAHAIKQTEGKADFVQFEMHFIHQDGEKRTIRVSSHPVRDETGVVTSIDGIAEDVTEQKTIHEQVRLSASVFAHSQEGIIITDANACIIDVNPACIKLTGYTRDEILGSNPSLFSSGIQEAMFYTEMWQLLTTSGSWKGEIWNRKKTGEVYSEWLSINAVHDDQSNVLNYVAIFYDNTYLKEHEAELERIAYNDALTGLPNRLLLRDRMQQALTQAERHDSLMAVCYLDLDSFKPINDTHGHEVGDEVLIEVARRLQEILRFGDTIARLGGDEFVLLILDLNNVEELEQVLDRILQSISQAYELPGATITLSASIGVSLHPLDTGEADTLLRHADQAMYVAKRQGKSRYNFFDPTDDQKATSTLALQQEINNALIEDQFCLHYQPKVNMRTGEVVGVEALIRWQHPEKGLLRPAEFLPFIEDCKLIIDLGNWVLRQSMLQMRHWKDEGLEIQVSVNIAPQQFQHSQFCSTLSLLLSEFADIPAKELELEILESTALHDIAHVRQIMEECIKLGVTFSLDDFGTGYSSLTYLKNLPATVLKIDKSFVNNLLNDPDNLAITEGILGLANAFHRTPIAEGVETIEQGSLLLKLGCDLAQGYVIARPMPAENLPVWINNFKLPPEWKASGLTGQASADFSLLMMAVEHHKVVARVINAIEHEATSLLPENIEDHQACEFGKWLAGEGVKHYDQSPVFNHVSVMHKQLHDLCQAVPELLSNGKNKQLYSIAEELKELRHSIIDNLHKLLGDESN